MAESKVRKRNPFRQIRRTFLSCFRPRKSISGSDPSRSRIGVARDELLDHQYSLVSRVGVGTFGTVYNAMDQRDNSTVAVKRIQADDKDTREIDLHKLARHVNVVALREAWVKPYSENQKPTKDIFMVMEYMPCSLEEEINKYAASFCTVPSILIKVFTHQMFRGLNYLHGIRIVHRDIKPTNLLVNNETGALKICDFGCAKLIKPGRVNRTYICSRYYRAPELVLGNLYNDESIDMWAAGCVFAECFRGHPIFPGKNTNHQFGAIADVLGNPTPEELNALKPTLKALHAKQRDASGTFDEHFPPQSPWDGIDLISRLLVYPPADRLKPLEALAHTYYDHLRLNFNKLRLPCGSRLPELFDFSPDELKNTPDDMVKQLIPNMTGNQCDGAPYHFTAQNTRDISGYVQLVKDDSKDTVSMDASTESSSIADIFSERESFDVDDEDLWDCQKITFLQYASD